ncbi:lytic transglycosylase domain-containing protein [Nostoc sp. CHAB 5834]|nr:lytic transglycosylase domain-containing protein [Nostoc sp. CHAB 5834]
MQLTLRFVLLLGMLAFVLPISNNGKKQEISELHTFEEKFLDSALLMPEQEAVASHLSSKYSKPFDFVASIVKDAYEEGARYNVPPLLILAIIEKESSFRHDVVNYYGATGLMQVVPRFHMDKVSKLTAGAVRNKSEAVEKLTEPTVNIKVGTAILADYIRGNNGNISAALARYSGKATNYEPNVSKFKIKLESITKKHKELRT